VPQFKQNVSGVLKHLWTLSASGCLSVKLKFKSQPADKPLQELTVAVMHLDHTVLAGFPKAFIQWKAAFMFIAGVKDWEVEQHLPIDSKRLMNKALNQNLEQSNW
jgi:hypothetical protein